ncbi:MAG: hypothetical protein ABSA93_31335 [Streptosporangiaceae bacterium]
MRPVLSGLVEIAYDANNQPTLHRVAGV